MRVLILYRELAGYIVSSINHLVENYKVKVDLVAYPVNKEAPFLFSFSDGVHVYRRSDLDSSALKELLRRYDYNLIVCGGWIDKEYLELVRAASPYRCAVAFDKQWQGSIKDVLASIYLKLKMKPLFRFAFVAGSEQSTFARKMGFDSKHILAGVYASDTLAFSQVYQARSKVGTSTKRKMWYAGRYIAQKGFNDLFEVFASLANGPLNGWELHAVGTGDQWESRTIHPSIVHHGFVQPNELKVLIEEGEIFVLPSLFEPWGVVVQEFSLAGYALLLSDKVGARTAFLQEKINGVSFQSGNREDLKRALIELGNRSRDELMEMGRVSNRLANTITPDTWSMQILKMMESKGDNVS